MEPELILLDEPCSGLDPISTAKIEEALVILKERYTIVLVTNNTKQAARAADETAFFLMGELIEMGPTARDLHEPRGQAHRGLRDREVRMSVADWTAGTLGTRCGRRSRRWRRSDSTSIMATSTP